MNKTFLLLLLSSLTFSLCAEELKLDYKSFYSHVKKLKGDETNNLKFAFGLRHIDENRMCRIESALISTQKKQIPLDVTTENRFSVPLERALRLADAKVILNLSDQANKCDMSVQLETVPSLLKQSYSKEELQSILQQYTVFFEDMGGFFSFMMPSVSGLVIHFDEGVGVKTIRTGQKIRNGRLELSEDDIDNLYQLRLPAKPIRITALTQSS